MDEAEKKKANWGKAAKLSLGVFGGLSLLMGYVSAAGMKKSEQESEARKAIDDFFAALNAHDIESASKMLHYPHIQIIGTDVTIWDDAASFQFSYDSLVAQGWTQSTLDSCAMRQNSKQKVHFETRVSLHKIDPSQNEICQVLWIMTRKNGQWGIQCQSIFNRGIMP